MAVLKGNDMTINRILWSFILLTYTAWAIAHVRLRWYQWQGRRLDRRLAQYEDES